MYFFRRNDFPRRVFEKNIIIIIRQGAGVGSPGVRKNSWAFAASWVCVGPIQRREACAARAREGNELSGCMNVPCSLGAPSTLPHPPSNNSWKTVVPVYYSNNRDSRITATIFFTTFRDRFMISLVGWSKNWFTDPAANVVNCPRERNEVTTGSLRNDRDKFRPQPLQHPLSDDQFPSHHPSINWSTLSLSSFLENLLVVCNANWLADLGHETFRSRQNFTSSSPREIPSVRKIISTLRFYEEILLSHILDYPGWHIE